MNDNYRTTTRFAVYGVTIWYIVLLAGLLYRFHIGGLSDLIGQALCGVLFLSLVVEKYRLERLK